MIKWTQAHPAVLAMARVLDCEPRDVPLAEEIAIHLPADRQYEAAYQDADDIRRFVELAEAINSGKTAEIKLPGVQWDMYVYALADGRRALIQTDAHVGGADVIVMEVAGE